MKYVIGAILSIILVFSLLTYFGPWDTYRVPQVGDGMGGCVGVGDLPVWYGEILRYTAGAQTEDDAKREDQEWLERNPEMQEFWEINEHGWLRPK